MNTGKRMVKYPKGGERRATSRGVKDEMNYGPCFRRLERTGVNGQMG